MTPESVRTSVLFRNPDCLSTPERDRFYRETYPNGQPFARLTLTFTAKGWSSSVIWKGTSSARGVGKTIEEAIAASIKTAEDDWGVTIKFRP